MNQLLFYRVLSCLICCVVVCPAKAQTEYFGSLDPATGTFSKLAVLPGVKWIQPEYFAYCEATKHYTFCGSFDAKRWRLYTLDANTGQILYAPEFRYPNDTNESVHNMAYSGRDGKLYALLGNRSAHTVSFAQLDERTGYCTGIRQLDIAGNYFTFDAAVIDNERNTFLFNSADTTRRSHLCSIDIASGRLVGNHAVSQLLSQLTYDEAARVVIALYVRPDSVRLISVNPLNGDTAVLYDRIPISGIYGLMGSFAYNARLHQYTFTGPDAGSRPQLTTVNTNGSLAYQQPFPFVSNQSDNVLGFESDNRQGRMYAIHWESQTPGNVLNGFSVLPNPFSENAAILLAKFYATVAASLRGCDGRLVRQMSFSNTTRCILERGTLAAGVYFLYVYGDGERLGSAKLLVQ